MVTCTRGENNLAKVHYRPRRNAKAPPSFPVLLEAEQCETMSIISRHSLHKLQIDSMFDDNRSIVSHHRLDDRSSIHERRRTSSSIQGSINNGAASSIADSRSRLLLDMDGSSGSNELPGSGKKVSNSVQAQIERMFTDVAKDATTGTFTVRCLGSLPLKDKVTSLVGLQEPLRQLYLTGAGQGNQNAGILDICSKGLRVRLSNGRDPQITPFPNIAVWSAVKFVVSSSEGGAAFLPLITDPDNIDKKSLFRPLSVADKRRLSSGLHSPLFAVVMRSQVIPKQLECHGFVCQTPEDAIVIAATLYQSLMAHMGNGASPTTHRPKNRNGISVISVGSSQATTKIMQSSTKLSVRRTNSQRSQRSQRSSALSSHRQQTRKKRIATSSIGSTESDTIDVIVESSTEERDKKKTSKSKRAPPVPTNPPNISKLSDSQKSTTSYVSDNNRRRSSNANSTDKESNYTASVPVEVGGDILTRVAIPRSGSFLNTAGLTRYKSRATRRHTGKVGGGGGSPLGFSELFNEFRLQENLHSLDEILNAIINTDGMSFNNLKPIYKEFLLKLAVTLTKDELYQRSKSIMRRQKKKKKTKKNASMVKNGRGFISTIGLKKVFKFGFNRSKRIKTPTKQTPLNPLAMELKNRNKKGKSSRIGTSGSEVSEMRTEHIMNAQNRNSSSGYDSDACTCASAERCYCSLGGDDINTKLSKASARNTNTMASCRTEDKCYCSMGDPVNEDSTTWCDTDSCRSVSKCYCQIEKKTARKTKTRAGKPDNLALDYELFTVGGNGRQVAQNEALSVKKSVEMAAVFADVKLSQTTDIRDMKQTVDGKSHSRRKSSSSSIKSSRSRTDEYIIKTSKSDFSNIDFKDKVFKKNTPLSKIDGNYQPTTPRPVSLSLEDSLGYLP